VSLGMGAALVSTVDEEVESAVELVISLVTDAVGCGIFCVVLAGLESVVLSASMETDAVTST
jgi:hypothetical protein